MSKKRIFVDMDNVLVNFQSGIDQQTPETLKNYENHLDDVPGIFSKMRPMPGAVEAMKALVNHFDVYILSTAPWNNSTAWSDKLEWVKKHLDFIVPGDDAPYFKKRLILSHHKDFCTGDFLIDDRPKHGAKDFSGEWIQFGSPKFPDWDTVVQYLMRFT